MKEQDQENNFKELLKQKANAFVMTPSDEVWANVKISLHEKRRQKYIWLWAAAVALLFGSGLFGWLMFGTQSGDIVYTHNSTKPSGDLSSTRPSIENKFGSGENATPAVENIPEETIPTENTQIHSSSENENHSDILSEYPHISEKRSGNDVEPKEDGQSYPFASLPSESQSRSIEILELLRTGDLSLLPHDSPEQPVLLTNSKTRSEPVADQLKAVFDYNEYPAHRFILEGEVIPTISYTRYGSKTKGSGQSNSTQGSTNSFTTMAANYSSPAPGYSAGLKVNYGLSKRFLLGLGIHFTRTSYEEAATATSTYPQFTADTNSVTSNAQTGTFYFPPSGSAGTAHINWLDLSTECEWLFWKHKKNQLSVKAGLGISKFLQFRFIADDHSEEAFSNSSVLKNNQPNPEIKVYSVTSSAGINYRRILSDHFAISTGVQLHYYVSNILTDNIYTTEHPYWTGLNAGIDYSF